jgi:hypothetical protein
MGLTIHYQLQSNASSLAKARQLVAELRKRACDLPFKEVGEVVELKGSHCDHKTYNGNNPLRWLAIQAGQFVVEEDSHYSVMPRHIVAFSTDPGDGCEEATFGLAVYPAFLYVRQPGTRNSRKVATGLKGWCWSSFCKTQYASDPSVGGVENFLRCHLSVIKVLDRAKEIGILAGVSDEGDFWEKRDIKALAQQVGEWNESMAAFVGHLKDTFGGDILAPITEYPDYEHLEARGRHKK